MNIPEQTLDYVVRTSIVGTMTGQGGADITDDIASAFNIHDPHAAQRPEEPVRVIGALQVAIDLGAEEAPGHRMLRIPLHPHGTTVLALTYRDGVLIAGEAANLVLNAGRAIQGMDYAMRSGILAAEAVVEAKGAGDFSASFLKNYRTALENSYVMQDLRGFQQAVHVLHSREMFTSVPRMVCDFGREFFTVDNRPTRKAYQILRDVRKEHVGFWDLVKLGARAGRAPRAFRRCARRTKPRRTRSGSSWPRCRTPGSRWSGRGSPRTSPSTRRGSCASTCSTAERSGTGAPGAAAVGLDEAVWDRIQDVNLKGAFLVSKAAIRPMLRQRSGRIVNMTSVIGLVGNAAVQSLPGAEADPRGRQAHQIPESREDPAGPHGAPGTVLDPAGGPARPGLRPGPADRRGIADCRGQGIAVPLSRRRG